MFVRLLSMVLSGWLIGLCGPFSLSAQVPANPIGINPFGLKWSQIKTDRVQVIFPRGLDTQGQRVANLVHYLWDQDTLSIGTKKAPVTILLQNQGALSNGFVTVGPFRSEFYTTPPQFDCTTNWLDLLTIHEYRHVQQFTNSRKGITELVRRTLGSWPWGGIASTVMPRWYLEGDATASETAFTASGRGRLPAFQMEYKALIQAGRRYDYEKAAAGSLKDFVPDWYGLGYYMIGYGRQHYGADLWKKVTDDAVRYKGLTFSFNKSVERYTGKRSPALYEAMRDELDSLWTNEQRDRQTIAVQRRSKAYHREVTNYNNPVYLDNRTLAVQRASFDQITELYSIDERGRETRLKARPGIMGGSLNSRLSTVGTKLCWAERAFDLRWANRSYSIIKTYDLATDQKKTLSRKSRYFAPTFSPDAQRICVVSVDDQGGTSLVIIDANNGAIIQSIPNPEQWYFSFPTWSADGRSLLVIAKQAERQQLFRLDLANPKLIALTPPSASQLSHPVAGDRWLYFSAAYNGTNNIYAVDYTQDRPDLKVFQLTDHILGAFQPSVSPNRKWLTYSAFSADGYFLEEAEVEALLWKTAEVPQLNSGWYANTLEQQEGGSIIGKVPNEKFEVRKFNTWKGLINPHSLLPSIVESEVGATLLMDNKFSTLSASIGGFYNLNEEEWSLLSSLNYAELFPVINLSHRFSGRSTSLINFSQRNAEEVILTAYSDSWNEHNLSAGLRLPLNLSAGRFFTFAQLRANYHRITVEDLENRFDRPNNFRDTFLLTGLPNPDLLRPLIANETFNAVDLRFIWSTRQRRALQHIQSRWGLLIDARHRRTIGTNNNEGSVSYLRADFYLPGLRPNHSFYINTYYQEQDLLDNYRFSNFFVFPRGHIGVLRDRMYKLGFNYSFPLLYPDLSISRMVFLKRIKANLFYDQGYFRSDLFTGFDLRSTGVELTFDIRGIRLLEIDFGVRYSYLIDPSLDSSQSRHQFNFLLLSITQ